MSRLRGIVAAAAAATLFGAAIDASASVMPPQSPQASAESRGPDGSTPLQWAVYKGDAAEVKRLLQAGAKVSEANDYGATPMQLAATIGDTAILKLLLDAGADVDSPNEDGQTALMAVARTGRVEAAKLLVKHGAKVNSVEQFGGQTALMWAAARRQPEMVKLLVSSGADLNARSIVREWNRHITAEGRAKDTNTGGLTPLIYAARENCLECVNALLAHHVDINLPDPDGVAPLTIAMMNGNWDIAKRLVEAGADVNTWDIYGMAPLHVAVEMDNGGGGAAGFLGGFFGNGARGWSIDPPNKADPAGLIRMLVDRGANPNQQMFYRAPRAPGSVSSGARGTTPFMRACAGGDIEVVKLLLAHGADVHLREADDETPMMLALAARRGGEDNVVQVLRVLHEAGADVNVVAKYHHLQRTRGGSALHVAVRLGLKKAMAELVSYGIDINVKDPDGLTALDYAMARGYVPFLATRQPPRDDLAKMLRGWGATVELAKTPDWPPVGPPIGYEATIWPL
jgi:uncharacterized protein